MATNLPYSEKIAQQLFFDPFYKGANRLCILTSKASPSMASWLLKTYEEKSIVNIKIEIIITNVYYDGINKLSHDGFNELHKRNNNFSCSYLFRDFPPLNTNYYIWLNNEDPLQAFSCPYTFTQDSILREHPFTINLCSAKNLYNNIYNNAINNSVYCHHSEVEEYVTIYSSNNFTSMSQINNICLSLLQKNGEIGTKSGLNWGQREGRNKNQAYIPLPAKVARSSFFPLNKQHFLVVTDDHHTLLLRVEQQNDKAITTPASNALLGEYFRNRLELSNGSYIKKEDLLKYGRTDVTFYKIDEEQYYMDFSISNRNT